MKNSIKTLEYDIRQMKRFSDTNSYVGTVKKGINIVGLDPPTPLKPNIITVYYKDSDNKKI